MESYPASVRRFKLSHKPQRGAVMRITRVLGVVAVLLAFACFAQAAEKGKGKKKKTHTARGLVTEVKKDADKDEGTFTAKVGGKKAKGDKPAVEATEKTFKVTAETKFEKVEHAKKGEKPETKPATFADLHEGDHVVVVAVGDVAKEVKIEVAKKKKNA
jgi:hypothetical protein